MLFLTIMPTPLRIIPFFVQAALNIYLISEIILVQYGDPDLESITDLQSKYGVAQDFAALSESSGNSPFQDPEFLHDDTSIGDWNTLLDIANPDMATCVESWRRFGWDGTATWIRVADVCNRKYGGARVACFNCGDIGTAIGRQDVDQGNVGDCWFLCGVSEVSMVKDLITWVVPSDNQTNDAGIYHFRFWYQGAWVDVVVDDYIPCICMTADCTPNILTVGCNFSLTENGKGEFWAMLVEKAFAKLIGNYTHIASNTPMYGLEILTGGFGTCICTSQAPPQCFENIKDWLDKKYLVCTGTSANAEGIIGNHAYSLNGAHVVTTNDGVQHQLVRLRNPWGKKEWTGDWSDDSPLWNNVSQEQKDAIHFVNKNDGEFWMPYTDMLTYYSSLSACWFTDPGTRSYEFAQFRTQWSRDKNTDGGWDAPWNNPRFLVTLSGGKTSTLVVGTLIQVKIYSGWDRRFVIRVFKVEPGTTVFDQEFFSYAQEILPAGTTEVIWSQMKSYSIYFGIPAGTYLVVPSSVVAGVENNIVVRIQSNGSEAAIVAN